MAVDDDPLVLQVKEARASVLEPYAGKSLHPNHWQRVIAGQRLMQSASDIFLGWTTGKNGKHYYVRQLREMKISAIVEDWDVNMLRTYSRMRALALARAHARSGDAAMISGYMGSSDAFDGAICEFAVEYADQTQRDYRAFVKAVRAGRVEATIESQTLSRNFRFAARLLDGFRPSIPPFSRARPGVQSAPFSAAPKEPSVPLPRALN